MVTYPDSESEAYLTCHLDTKWSFRTPDRYEGSQQTDIKTSQWQSLKQSYRTATKVRFELLFIQKIDDTLQVIWNFNLPLVQKSAGHLINWLRKKH